MIRLFILLCFYSLISLNGSSQGHPSLILTEEGVANLRKGLGKVALFDKVLANAKSEVDHEIALGIKVPIPKDMAGGYTHERHKRNWIIMQLAGNLYQITQEETYAKYIKDNLWPILRCIQHYQSTQQKDLTQRGKYFGNVSMMQTGSCM